ncbi:MAG TPA: cysteate synthase [Candidatus Poseidoniales archaeon]|nr:cysteate synthase [Candidatus Poseidoniales archaeon]
MDLSRRWKAEWIVKIMLHHKLVCLITGDVIDDEYTLHHTDGALLSTQYSRKLNPRDLLGVWKYADWLPTSTTSENVAGTITYKAEKLAEALGMSNLWVTFHGYWPEKGGLCPTGTFKDMEAVPTLVRIADHDCKGIICASAGNTARSFSYYCGLSDTPLIVIVGASHAHRLWLPKNHPRHSVKIVIIEDGDYWSATKVSKKLAQKLEGWQLEGGAHNIARRDGIGTLMLDAAFTIGALPTHYFQGIGGGPGPIGVNEMAGRLIDSGIFEGPLPRQHVSQNTQHCPIHNAWQDARSTLQDSDFPTHEVEVYSDFLLNKSPCYSPAGGVYDTLKQSNGQTYIVEEKDAIAAKTLFEDIEGIDILSPAAVALASLQQALASGEIGVDDCTVLNISGGGTERIAEDMEITKIEPWLTINEENAVAGILAKLQA